MYIDPETGKEHQPRLWNEPLYITFEALSPQGKSKGRRTLLMGKKNLNEDEFTIAGIKKLRTPPYKGIHSVYSGFNAAFQKRFDKSPVDHQIAMVKAGKLQTRPAKGGAMLYLPGEMVDASIDKTIATIEG